MGADPIADLFPELDDKDRFPGGRAPRRVMPETAKPTIAPDWDANPTIKIHKGEEREFFTVGDLANALGKKPVTIRSWEDKGYLPRSRYRGPTPKGEGIPGKTVKGRRLYTRQQIEIVITAALEAGVAGPNALYRPDWRKFTKTVVDGWKSIG